MSEEWHSEQKGRFTEDGRFELQVPYVEDTELAMGILRHGGLAAVVAPASLRAMVRKQLQEALVLNAT